MNNKSAKNILRVAAAGAGKTYTICREAEKEIQHLENSGNHYSRVLLLSYATKAVQSIDEELRKENSGVIPKRIEVMSWYSFLISEMIKPYQSEIYDINELKELYFDPHPTGFNRYKTGSPRRYATSEGNIKSNQLAELALVLNAQSQDAIIRRLEKIYTHIFIDEVQDLSGYDLNIIEALMRSKISVTVVGDGKQAVFRTSYTTKNKGKGGEKIWEYFLNLEHGGLAVVDRQNVSRRFNDEICNFANRVYPNENNIKTCMSTQTEHDGVYLILHQDVSRYMDYFHPTVLRWDRRTKTDGYEAINFGECKGQTFDRILIYPNGKLNDFLLKGKTLTSQIKYYVAVTRPRYSIAFVIDKMPNACVLDMYETTDIIIDSGKIMSWHLKPNPDYDIK